MSKSNEELIKEFFDKGGKVEILPPGENTSTAPIGRLTKQPVSLFSLEEADLLFGEKIERQSKTKNVDISNINLALIPDHLKKILLSKFDSVTKEEE